MLSVYKSMNYLNVATLKLDTKSKATNTYYKHLLAQYHGIQGLSHVNQPGKPVPGTKVSQV